MQLKFYKDFVRRQKLKKPIITRKLERKCLNEGTNQHGKRKTTQVTEND